MTSHGQHKNLVVCCDGTWCGDSAGTYSNMKIIARQFAGQDVPDDGKAIYRTTPKGELFKVRYFSGVGVIGQNWAQKAVDGTLAVSIRKRCVEVYRFIAKHYNPGDKIWLFGHSRGAFTVRCVAGMINNYGILDKHKAGLDLDKLCDRVYTRYRWASELPNSTEANKFWDAHSHKRGNNPPIRFMGLLDTVGALGVPTLVPGKHVSYEFYDRRISSEVQDAYQGLALDDQLAVFTPCQIDPTPGRIHYKGHGRTPVHYVREEKWFPGAHFDIGRQDFVLDSVINGSMYEMILPKFSYTPGLANPPLLWLLNKAYSIDGNCADLPLDAEGVNLDTNDTPWSWKLGEYLNKPLIKPYYSALAQPDARDPGNGVIIDRSGSNVGAYASYLADLAAAADGVGRALGRGIKVIGTPADLTGVLIDAGLYLAKEQLISDREVPAHVNWHNEKLKVPTAVTAQSLATSAAEELGAAAAAGTVVLGESVSSLPGRLADVIGAVISVPGKAISVGLSLPGRVVNTVGHAAEGTHNTAKVARELVGSFATGFKQAQARQQLEV